MDLAPAEKLTITVTVDNYYDTVRKNPSMGIIFRIVPGQTVQAEHGLSYVLESVVGGVHSSFMFDFGLSSRALMNNLQLLGIDVAAMQAFVLSHGHFDHWGGLIELLKTHSRCIKEGTPLYVGDEAFANRFILWSGSKDASDLGSLNRGQIEALKKVSVRGVLDPLEIVPGACLTGTIERVTPYEKPPSRLLILRNGNMEEDDFRGEMAVVCNVKGKGPVVVSGCAHAGIINTVRHAQKITGIERVHAVIGGFHLVNLSAGIIEETIADMKAIGPEYIIPTHCTGFEAVTAFQREMPDQFVLSTAGTRYTLGA